MTVPALLVYSTGPIAVSGDNLNTFVQTAQTAAQVRTFTGVSGMCILLQGITTAGDGFGGLFYWNSAATAADDNANVLVPNGTVPGAWLRLTTATTQAGVFTGTAMSAGFSFITAGLTPQAAYQLSHAGKFATLGLAATIAVPASSTAYEVDAIAGYITNASATTGVSAGSFYAYNLVAGAVSWALNPLVSDQGFASTVSGAEFDIGASNPASSAYGINMIGVFPGGTPATAIAYQASILNSPWQYVMVSYDGTSESFALVGALGTTASSNGQPTQYNVRDASNTVRYCDIQAQAGTAGANLVFTTPTGAVIMTGAELVAGLATFQAGMSVTAAATVLAGFISGTTAVGSITTNGTTTSYNTTSDRRLKTLDGPADGSLIDRLKVYTGAFKAAPDIKRSMFIADEVQEVLPWTVTGEKDAVEPADVLDPREQVVRRKGDIVAQAIDHSALVPELVAKVQALQAEIASLREFVGTLIPKAGAA